MKKIRSKIIKDLIMDNINVLQAMQSLNLMLEDIEDNEVKTWVNNELNGYDNEVEIPSYRIINCVLVGNIQVGCAIYSNINIPLSNKEAIDYLTKVKIKEPISILIQLAKAEIENERHSLSMDVNTMLVNKYQATNGDVIKASRYLSLYAYNNILAIIKDKLLEIFKTLEKTYGNLDELYIDFSDIDMKSTVIKKIESIVYTDNSTHIGNNNSIKESAVGGNNEN